MRRRSPSISCTSAPSSTNVVNGVIKSCINIVYAKRVPIEIAPSITRNPPSVRIAADWNYNPPKQLWRQRVGPAWSSVIVIGDRLFTQEQRGDVETVVAAVRAVLA